MGAFGALSFFSKQTNIGFFVGLFVFLVVNLKNSIFKKKLISYLMGGVVASIVILGIVWACGICEDWFYACFTFNRLYGNVGVGKLARIASTLPKVWPLLLWVVMGIIVCEHKAFICRGAFVGLIVWCSWEYLFFVLGQGPCGYQYEPLIVPAYVMTLGVWAFFDSKVAQQSSLFEFGALKRLCVVLLVSVGVCYAYRPLMRSIFEVYHEIKWHNRAEDGMGRDATADLAADLAKLPNANLFVWGIQPRLHWLTGRESPFKPHYQWISLLVDQRDNTSVYLERMKEKDFILLERQDSFALMTRDIKQGQEKGSLIGKFVDYVRVNMKEVPCSYPAYKMYIPKTWPWQD